ncbi:MAG: GNAT family N-acetyltransferase [Candidatus Woesearchaeota archaeon]|nr:GNAT family N-acetyltransferase [Candidatus Woesearchaeota archaeon]
MDFEISDAVEDDVFRICSIAKKVLPEFFTADQVIRKINDPYYSVITGRYGGTIAGFSISRLMDTNNALYLQKRTVMEALGVKHLPASAGVILSVGVLPEYAHRGLGTNLGKNALEFLDSHIIGNESGKLFATYMWPNGTSGGLLKKMGFEPIPGWNGEQFKDGTREQLYCKLVLP